MEGLITGVDAERELLQVEMTERLRLLNAVRGKDDPITEHRRERELNESIDGYSDMLKAAARLATEQMLEEMPEGA